MSGVICNQLAFQQIATFYQFLLHAVATLNVSNAEGKVMILLLKFFQRLLNSFDAIFRQETSTTLQQKSQKQILRHSAVCLLSAKICFCLWLSIKHFPLSFQSAEWAGNIVVRSLEVCLRIISFRHPFGLPVWNFGRLWVNRRLFLHPGAR